MAKKSLRKAGRSNSTAGYGRPPVASRWKKGMSGNPSGRPRGSRNLKSMIRKRLLAQVTVHENGKARKITSLEALLAKALNEALLGRPKAFIDVCKFLQSAALLSFEDLEENPFEQYPSQVTIKIIRPEPRPGDPNYRALDKGPPQIRATKEPS
jgi:hypothetical protein